MLWHHVHFSGIWLKQNTFWQLTILRPINQTPHSLWRRANTRNVSFSISVRWSIYIINSVDKPNFRVSLPHRRSTTVSLETNPLYPIGCLVWKQTPLCAHLVNLLFAARTGGSWRFPAFPTDKIPHPVHNFWRVLLPGEKSNPGSRQYIYHFPDSRTVFWSNLESRKYPPRPWNNE